MTGDNVSPATTVSGWASLPLYIRLVAYQERDGTIRKLSKHKLYTRTWIAQRATSLSYRAVIVKACGQYHLSRSDDTFMSFPRKTAALAAMRMTDG